MKNIFEKLKVGTNADNQHLLFIKSKNNKLILQTNSPHISVTYLTGIGWNHNEPCYRCNFDELSKFICSFDESHTTEFHIADNQLFVKINNSKYKTAISPATLPPALKPMSTIGSLKTELLKNAINDISNFADTKEAIDIKTIIALQGFKTHNLIKLSATNGNMGAISIIPNLDTINDFTLTLLNSSIKSLIPKLESENVILQTDGDVLTIIDGNVMYTIRLTGVKPIALEEIVKIKPNAIGITVNTSELDEALRLIINTVGNTGVSFKVDTNGFCDIQTQSTKTTIHTTLGTAITEPILFAIDPKKLKKALNTIYDDTVTIYASNEDTSPIWIYTPTMKRAIMKVTIK